MTFRAAILAVVTIACMVGGGTLAPAFAQARPGAAEADVARVAAQADGTGTSPLQDPLADVLLEAGEDGTLLTAQVGYRTRKEDNNFQLGIKFKAPVDAETKEATFVNLDGLTAGTTGALAVTFERTGKPLLASGRHWWCCDDEAPAEEVRPFEAICNEVNAAAVEQLAAGTTDLPKNEACSIDLLRKDAYWTNEVQQRLDKGLWEDCQNLNKKRPSGWLAPPGVKPDHGAGYTQSCNEETLLALRRAALDEDLKKSAHLLLNVPGFETASEEERVAEQLWQRCEAFNLERQAVRFHRSGLSAPESKECTIGELVTALRTEELRKREKEIENAACQAAFVVPTEKLFSSKPTGTNPCLMSSVLSWAATSERPAYWYRRTLRAIPLAFYYVTAEALVVDQTFKFLDQEAGFAERSSDGHSRSLSLNFSVYQGGWLGGVSYARLITLKASPSRQICLPTDGDALICQQAALAGPSETEMEVVRGEVKTWLRPGLGTTLRTNYDLDNGEWEHHLLLHFLRDPKKGLTGGIDIQYNTALADQDEEHLTARVFVGTKFALPFLPNSP